MTKTEIKSLLIRFTSRKFLIALLGVAIAFGVPLTDMQIAAITVLITAFVAVEGTADAVSRVSRVIDEA